MATKTADLCVSADFGLSDAAEFFRRLERVDALDENLGAVVIEKMQPLPADSGGSQSIHVEAKVNLLKCGKTNPGTNLLEFLGLIEIR